MKCGWDPTRKMRILIGDGHRAETQGVCRGIEIEVNGEKFKIDVVLFDLKDIDMILGMSWLASVGEMLVDWGKQTVRFTTSQGKKLLKGVNNEESLAAQIKGLVGDSPTVPIEESRVSNKGNWKTCLTNLLNQKGCHLFVPRSIKSY